MKITLVKRRWSSRVGLREGLGYGIFILTALVAGVAQARQANQQASQGAAQNQEAQPQIKTEQGSTPKISMDVKTVSVPVTVRDKHGKIISNLTKDEFVVEEDGRPQTVNYFAVGIAGGYEFEPAAGVGGGAQSELQLSGSPAAGK
jgi:hypothetical protein